MANVPMNIGDTGALMRRGLIDRAIGSLRTIGGSEVRCMATDLSEQTQRRVLELGFEGFATELVERLFQPGWKPAPCGLVAVPKSKGGHRFITPPQDLDRLWSWALYDIIYPKIAPQLHPCSYGFVRGRSNQGAVRALEDAIRARPDGVLKQADVVRCFASLPVDGLLSCLWPIIRNPMAMYLIESAFRSRPRHERIRQVRRELVQAGTATKSDLEYLDALHQTRRGTPEGSALSAVTCNVYMRPLVDALVAALPGATVVHYGDNVALWLRPGQERIAEAVLQEQSRSLRVEIEVESVVVPPCQSSAEFLGVEFVWSGSDVRLGVPDRVVVEIVEVVKGLPGLVEQEAGVGRAGDHRKPKSKPIGNVVEGFVKLVSPRLTYYRDADIGLLRHALWDAAAGWDEADRYAVLGLAARGWLGSRGRWGRYVDKAVLEADVRVWERRMPVDLGGSWSEGHEVNRGRENVIVETLSGLYGQDGHRMAQEAVAQTAPGDGGQADKGGRGDGRAAESGALLAAARRA